MSKINTDYWGANVSPYNDGTNSYSWGLSTNNIRALLQDSKYDPNTDSFDMTVSPWGIGYSAAGNRGQIVIQRQGSVDGYAPGVIKKISFEGIDRENTNRPFYIPNSGAGGARDNYNWIMARVGGDCDIDSNYYLIDKYNGQILAANSKSSDCISNQYACTFFNYQHFKLAIRAFNYIDLDTGAIGQYSFVQSNSPSDAKTNFDNYSFPEHMAITTIYVQPRGYAMQVGSPTQWIENPAPGAYGLMQMRGHTIGDEYLFNKIGLSAGTDDKYKLFAGWNLGAYGVRDSTNTYYTLPRDYYSSSPYVRNIPVQEIDYRSAPKGINYSLVQVDGLGAGVKNNYDTTLVSNYCDKEQSFADIKYKQRPLLYTATNNVYSEIKEGTALQTGQGQIRATSIYEVIDSDTFTKAQILSLIKHEVAFYGFQFYISWGNANGGTWSVGDDDLYLPVFDEHLITTGRYASGSAALTAPNATWGNVFDDSMPTYDKDYNPKPDEKNKDENDSGDLYNFGSWNKFPSCLSAYAMSLEKFQSVLQSINSMYQTDPDGVKKWELDFKGSNPSDYIVAAYVSVCNFGLTDTPYPITIGPVNLADTVPSMTAYKIVFGKSGYFDCGSVDIDPFYNDFRDYAPYTQLELYLPLCGNVDLDPAYFMGHSVSITYYYDYNTMSCSACIYRDGITLYKVINGSIGAEIPLTSMRMGDYQNAIHTLEQAQKQNEIRMASAMVSMGISAAGLLAAPATGGASLGLTALGLSGVKSGIETVNAIDDISYNIEHKQPTPTQTGASEAQNAFCVGSMYPYLFIKRAKTLESFDAEIYGHTVGYACNINAHIGDMSGYTVATNIDTSGINATVEEINAIKQAFSKGVYI